MALAEILGMPRNWIGYVFLLVTVSLYAGIGIVCRTSDQVEYYVAGRRVPAIYNGMATAADWMSVASFIGVAGTLYLTGYGGLAYIMGWTGGYVLVAMLLAPYLRRFGQYTIPDFMGARYGGNLPRLAGVACAILCSFTYLVAQIYGVGIITTRMTGISFELGIFVALGGMLVCSFLGGMRAVTWTQVGQYIILVIAYLVPVVWLSVKHTGSPVPQVSAGIVLQQVAEKESYLLNDTGEIEVRRIWQERADEMGQRIAALPESWTLEKDKLRSRLAQLNATDAPMVEIRSLERELASYPPNAEGSARGLVAVQGPVRGARRAAHAACRAVSRQGRGRAQQHAHQLPGAGAVSDAGHRRHAAHPDAFIHHALGERGAALGVLVPAVHPAAVLHGAGAGPAGQVRGLHAGGRLQLPQPAQLHAWSAVDSNLLDVTDVNRDGIVQLGEISMGADVVVLAMPEIGGLPYVISGLVAAGGWPPRCPPPTAAADPVELAVARHVVPGGVAAHAGGAACDGVQDPAAGGGVRRGLGRGAQAGRHPVHGVRRLLLRRLVLLPGAGHGRVLAAREQVGATLGMAAGLLVTFST